jgi:hypothetical protein
MTIKQPQQRYEIGMVGAGGVGRNLVLTMADRVGRCRERDERSRKAVRHG